MSFVQESLKPEVFWSAFAAIGTFAAVLVAIFLPSINSNIRNNKIEKLIQAEIKHNYRVIRNMASNAATTLPNNIEIDAFSRNKALAENINLHLWKEFKYRLGSERPDKFEIYDSIYLYAEEIVSALNIDRRMVTTVQRNAANSYLAKCEELKLDPK